MNDLRGRVLKSTGKWYQVLLPNGEIVECRIRGRLRLEGLKTTNPIAAGDIVILDSKSDDEGKRVIVNYEVRENYIVRKSTNLSKQMHILAANIDQAYLMVTLKFPETHFVFIDRFLVAAESFRIPTTLIFNKVDLLDDEELLSLKAIMFMYESIGYPCHAISATNAADVQFLRNEITDQQVMIAGHSGTGKSTLVNALDPTLDLRVGEISVAHHQGQHTTTFAEMHPLQSGGFIIDTPGIRAFGVVNLEKEVISHYFPEMRKLIGACKFHNCQHLNEPACAVKGAVKNGEIYESRYLTYLQLMSEDGEAYRRNKRGLE
ncbi:ribosome small subunit-dependent GTPase A [Fluviicola sp.]|jgi:ribosome biogenesis GTPase|uniref:ribosome small subunit-dependent GTPase A n=1 Tax=Fluviicola sp. TaxID=1917219 RepID=UPI002818E5DA|nr:ribosome small subunit-dependent GTPase A [Fluviicola sp.]MDR0801093.1 ribosome small subunit-dependent GTPase A [Fluviicola sp.]